MSRAMAKALNAGSFPFPWSLMLCVTLAVFVMTLAGCDDPRDSKDWWYVGEAVPGDALKAARFGLRLDHGSEVCRQWMSDDGADWIITCPSGNYWWKRRT